MKKSIYKSYDELPLILNMRNGIPGETQRSGFAGERRNSGMSERCRWEQCERYAACDDALGISVNTAAKYMGLLAEHGLIVTERTDVITRDGLKRNGCLQYRILPIQNAINQFHSRQLSALEQTEAQQQAEKSGVEFVPPDKAQSA